MSSLRAAATLAMFVPRRASIRSLSAAAARWRQATVVCYGHSDTIELAQTPAIWYGAFANTAGRAVLLREPGENILAIFTTDIISDAEQIVAR